MTAFSANYQIYRMKMCITSNMEKNIFKEYGGGKYK